MFTEKKNIPASPSVSAFLQGLFDYAGLFPPANLTMSLALREFANDQKERDSWMTGPFVCPVSRLMELIDEKQSFETIKPIRLSLLPRTTSSSVSFASSFREDVEIIERLQSDYPDTFQVAMMEIRVPADTVENADDHHADDHHADEHRTEKQHADDYHGDDYHGLDQWLTFLTSELEDMACAPPKVFLEVGRGGDYKNADYKHAVETVVHSISSLREPAVDVGLKIRCGGMNQSDYPSSLEIAQFLKTVIAGNQFFKATAGLHHPVRHYNEDAGATMHGFLNVFFAAIFCAALKLDINELITVIEAEDPARFQFVDDGIRFDDHFVPTETLQRIRTSQVMSIGSCSFSEPREDLRSLNWLVAN